MSNEVVIEPRSVGIPGYLKDIWKHRKLLYFFCGKQVKERYAAYLFGWFWFIFRPLAPALTSTLIFGNLMQVPSDGVPYLLFVLTGSSIWGVFGGSLNILTRSLQRNKKIISKLYFPRIIVLIASFPHVLMDFVLFFFLVALAGFMFYLNNGNVYIKVRIELLFMFFFIFLAMLMALSVGMFTSVLNVKVRDVRFTIPYILQIWSYITPIIYPLSFIPEKWRWVAYMNPMTSVVEGFKWSVLGKGELSWDGLFISICFIVVFLIAGLWFFTRAEAKVVDNL